MTGTNTQLAYQRTCVIINMADQDVQMNSNSIFKKIILVKYSKHEKIFNTGYLCIVFNL